MTRLRKSKKQNIIVSSHWSVAPVVISLVFFVFASSIGVIYSKHLSRQRFSELQILQNARDELHVEWSQLLLEQGTWATDARVERVAREHLNMLVPPTDKIMVIRP